MILYKENPNLGIKTVTTVNNEKEYRRNCKMIKGQFHVINKDCFQIGDTWYRTSSGLIEFDHEEGKWVLVKETNLLRGIIGFEKNKPVIGCFSHNKYNNVHVHKHEYALNAEILLDNNFIEDISRNTWYNKGDLSSEQISKMLSIRDGVDYKNKGYNIEDNAEEFQNKIKAFEEYPLIPNVPASTFSKFLKDRTFGAELELCRGAIPDNLQYRTGIVMCRDGSIAGGEVVTVPLKGAKGVENLISISKLLSPRSQVDIKCSYHLHLGNIPKSRNYLCTLYMLGLAIQDDMFKMFPYYKTEPQGIKNKNYCQKLKRLSVYPLKDESKDGYTSFLEDAYTKIFTFLSDGTPPSEFGTKRKFKHPIAQKWNRASRYYYLNLQNMIFSERGTAEFRIHHGTLNTQKIINWLFICNAVVAYAEVNEKKILTGKKITLEDVLNYYKDNFSDNADAVFLSKYLIAYYKDRVDYFKKDHEKGDYISQKEADNDKNYSFTFEGVTDLF